MIKTLVPIICIVLCFLSLNFLITHQINDTELQLAKSAKFQPNQKVRIIEHNLNCTIAKIAQNYTLSTGVMAVPYDYVIYCGPIRASKDHIVYVKEHEIELINPQPIQPQSFNINDPKPTNQHSDLLQPKTYLN